MEMKKMKREKHIWCEGSRQHVISYQYGINGVKMVCTEKNCEINFPTDVGTTDRTDKKSS